MYLFYNSYIWFGNSLSNNKLANLIDLARFHRALKMKHRAAALRRGILRISNEK